MPDTKAASSTQAFQNTWLSRYPWPEKVVTDNGPEFNGHEFEFMLMNFGIKRGRISAHTPTANAVAESIHRGMGMILRTLFEGRKPATVEAWDALYDEAVAQLLRACRCSANTSLQGVAPGALVFGRDMHLNIPIVADILSISQNAQLRTDARLVKENARRTRHEYRVGDNVYVNNHFSSADKLKPAWVGPFPVLQVHANGTLTVQRGQVHERISLRRIKPV